MASRAAAMAAIVALAAVAAAAAQEPDAPGADGQSTVPEEVPMTAPMFITGNSWTVLAGPTDGEVVAYSFSVAGVSGGRLVVEVRRGPARGTAGDGPAWELGFDPDTAALVRMVHRSADGEAFVAFRDDEGSPCVHAGGLYPGADEAWLFDWPFGAVAGSAAVSWAALPDGSREARLSMGRGDARVETVQTWTPGEPFWDESVRYSGGRETARAARLMPADLHGRAPLQAVVDPVSGTDVTGAYVAAVVEEYRRGRDPLIERAEALDAATDSASLAAELEALRERAAFALKGAVPRDLEEEFARDAERLSAAAAEPRVWTLQDIYDRERAAEGPVVLPPQVNGEFLSEARDHEQAGDLAWLLDGFARYEALARADPGRFEQGNPLLGAPPDGFWQPSESAKRLAELGDAVERVLAGIDTRERLESVLVALLGRDSTPAVLAYDRFRFEHLDVVGSGRFVYPCPAERRELPVTAILFERAAALGIAGARAPITQPEARPSAPLDAEDNRRLLEELLDLVRRGGRLDAETVRRLVAAELRAREETGMDIILAGPGGADAGNRLCELGYGLWWGAEAAWTLAAVDSFEPSKNGPVIKVRCVMEYESSRRLHGESPPLRKTAIVELDPSDTPPSSGFVFRWA